jgi:alpha-L-fucosidase
LLSNVIATNNLRSNNYNGIIVPVPTAPQQIRYQSTDFVALIHFNMATFAKDGDPGCSEENWNVHASYATGLTSDPTTFDPKLLNTTQWFDSIAGLGANIAVLTAKHGCGFCLWPTQSVLPDGTPYQYHTSYDIVQEFVNLAKVWDMGFIFQY